VRGELPALVNELTLTGRSFFRESFTETGAAASLPASDLFLTREFCSAPDDEDMALNHER